MDRSEEIKETKKFISKAIKKIVKIRPNLHYKKYEKTLDSAHNHLKNAYMRLSILDDQLKEY